MISDFNNGETLQARIDLTDALKDKSLTSLVGANEQVQFDFIDLLRKERPSIVLSFQTIEGYYRVLKACVEVGECNESTLKHYIEPYTTNLFNFYGPLIPIIKEEYVIDDFGQSIAFFLPR